MTYGHIQTSSPAGLDDSYRSGNNRQVTLILIFLSVEDVSFYRSKSKKWQALRCLSAFVIEFVPSGPKTLDQGIQNRNDTVDATIDAHSVSIHCA